MTRYRFSSSCDAQADYAALHRCRSAGGLAGFFHEQCLYKITTADNHRAGLEAGIVFANSHGMLHDRVSALRQANIYERQNYRHIVGMPSILSQDDGGFAARHRSWWCAPCVTAIPTSSPPGAISTTTA